MHDPRPLVAAAASAAQAQQWDDAAALAQAALAIDANAPRAWALVGMAHEAKGELEQARAAYERAVSLDDMDLATSLACARVQARLGALGPARALASYVLLKEHNAPSLRAEAAALVKSLAEQEGRA
ncbi:MAG: tetratricopeptide repeat protein [Deltaproteobacteria bacterium]|nr:tetratricopeptide repeat protein [Deltaproteobacteria bacterium]